MTSELLSETQNVSAQIIGKPLSKVESNEKSVREVSVVLILFKFFFNNSVEPKILFAKLMTKSWLKTIAILNFMRTLMKNRKLFAESLNCDF